MSADPKDCRERALRCAERTSTIRTPALKAELIKLSRGLLERSIELERRIGLLGGLEELHSGTALHLLRVRSGVADRRVAECKRLLDGWRELADREQVVGKSSAHDLLAAFQADLSEAIREKEDAEKALAARLRNLFKSANGREPHTGQELDDWLTSAEGKAA